MNKRTACELPGVNWFSVVVCERCPCITNQCLEFASHKINSPDIIVCGCTCKPSCKAQWKGEEDKADRGRGGKTTAGNGQAWSLGSGEQGKMEKTGCGIICGAQTTLTVKGLMMMLLLNCIANVCFDFASPKINSPDIILYGWGSKYQLTQLVS